MINLNEIRKVDDIPEEYRMYIVILFDEDEISITSTQKRILETGGTQFFKLPNGELINKSAIAKVILDKEKTKKTFLDAHPQFGKQEDPQLPESTGHVNKEGIKVIEGMKKDLARKLHMTSLAPMK